jgi:hypothetical protein
MIAGVIPQAYSLAKPFVAHVQANLKRTTTRTTLLNALLWGLHTYIRPIVRIFGISRLK